ncbi:MAG: hypothetical protein H7338_19415 [Candidatus Sericytochromatia bacterium]|nr:hypothetical protein [Candidatus Sericytochromatia bacterium]
MPTLLSLFTSSIAGFAAHALVGDYLSTMADFLVSTAVSGAVYVASLVYLQRLRGD